MPTRRTFLRNSAILAGGMLLPAELLAARKRSLLVLHTNDFHSRLEPFPADHPKYPGMGGIEQLKTLINEARAGRDDTLLLDSGDIFQGTPYFNRFGGVPELEWMNLAGYEACTLGNHDFDMGVDHLAAVLKDHARFAVVNCNYDLSDTPLKDIVKPYHVVKRGGIRVGVTGVGIDPAGLIPDHLCKGVVYRDPAKSLQPVVDHLRRRLRCKVVIVLSHLGFQYKDERISDLKLAPALRGVNLILGGHTHTFLDQSVAIEDAGNKLTKISQSGWAGLRLGKIEFKRF